MVSFKTAVSKSLYKIKANAISLVEMYQNASRRVAGGKDDDGIKRVDEKIDGENKDESRVHKPHV